MTSRFPINPLDEVGSVNLGSKNRHGENGNNPSQIVDHADDEWVKVVAALQDDNHLSGHDFDRAQQSFEKFKGLLPQIEARLKSFNNET